MSRLAGFATGNPDSEGIEVAIKHQISDIQSPIQSNASRTTREKTFVNWVTLGKIGKGLSFVDIALAIASVVVALVHELAQIADVELADQLWAVTRGVLILPWTVGNDVTSLNISVDIIVEVTLGKFGRGFNFIDVALAEAVVVVTLLEKLGQSVDVEVADQLGALAARDVLVLPGTIIVGSRLKHSGKSGGIYVGQDVSVKEYRCLVSFEDRRWNFKET
ncbi:MAG: hypothetical protein LQ350_008590 [Teloschistes chrysophthalmus]|nr:MAG: hypothetical protein LQ350_008590 [Niorma chrysophthalma]